MKEAEIRPKELFEKYLSLSQADASRVFGAYSASPIPCPGCGSEAAEFAFTKNTFEWRECSKCRSLYVSPRWMLALGHDPGTFDQSLAWWTAQIHPDDLPHVKAEMARHFQGETEHFEFVHR